MDYKKEYNDLIARINAVKDKPRTGMKDGHYYNGYVETGIRDALDYIINPESEDERIRKSIISIINQYARMCEKEGDPCEAFLIDDALAYLEKQKEQRPAESTALQKAFINSKIDYALEEKCDASDYAEVILPTSVTYGENEKEYKLHKIIEAAFIAGQKKEQKPADWGEEDEAAYGDLIWCIEQAKKSAKDENDMGNIWFAENWVKKQLKSPRPQPNAELTLLDENIIKAAVAFIEQNDHFNCWGGIDKHTVIKALRSLKPHWKPSEEQMSCLWQASIYYKSGKIKITGKTLESLYNDLKKL